MFHKLKRIHYVVILLVLILGGSGLYLFRPHHQPRTVKSPPPAPTAATSHSTPGNPAPNPLLAAYRPAVTNGLITNEYAYFNQDDPAAKASPDWQMTSGTLFARNGYFWTGKPDSCSGPNADSTNCTDSDVFRLNTVRKFDGNIGLSFSLMQNTDIHNSGCNNGDTCWHGAHAWLRYQNEFNLYYVSVQRADGQVVIKRKVPCGDDNSGTYVVLGSYVPHDFRTGAWETYATTIQTNGDGSVTIKLYDDTTGKTQLVDTGIDKGGTNPNWSPQCDTPGKYPSAAYQPITAPGNVGIRGDYADFMFTNFQVSRLGS